MADLWSEREILPNQPVGPGGRVLPACCPVLLTVIKRDFLVHHLQLSQGILATLWSPLPKCCYIFVFKTSGLGAEGLRHRRSCAEQTEVINTAPYASFTLLLFSPRRYPLRRGSSFTFLTPGPHWDFTLVSKPLVVLVFLMLLREVCLLRIWRRLLSRRRCWVHKRWPVLKLIFVSGLS